MRELLHSKIHKATVTEAESDYVGSITIDQELMDRIDLWEGQKVLITSNTSGVRLETYVIPGVRNSGEICMNGPCAHLIKKGEEIVIISFQFGERLVEPKVILVDEKNRFVRYL